MNLAALRLWMTVAEMGSFSRAADSLFISQPAVSKRVQELEESLGVSLLDRSGRMVRLTEAGQILYRYSQQIFAAERAAESALSQLRDLSQGHLSVGASNTIGTYLLPALLGQFHDQYPGIHLSMEVGNTQQMIDQLRHKPLDIAFVEAPVAAPDLVVTPWKNDRLVVIAATDHHLAAQSVVSLENLTREVFVMREPGSGTRDVAEDALRQHNIALSIAFELGSNDAVKQAVSAGLGLAIISEVTLELEMALSRLAVLNVPELKLNRDLTHVTMIERPHSPALTAFLKSL
ncbi:MAG: LysR substrate-binding domain-containing protein [Aggregatilineales bacterium]